MDGLEVDRVYLNDRSPHHAESWWDRYLAGLEGLTATARAALQVDCQYIVARGILGAGAPGSAGWSNDRVRTGLVMGSVQSGKTASMLGATALALDSGVDIVVILAGTRLSLWRQTYERLLSQLDAGDDDVSKAERRTLSPGTAVLNAGASGSLQDTYRLSSAQIRRKLSKNRPLIMVAMKQTSHLYALGNSLRSSVFSTVRSLDRPVHMLVLDDEADDGSVLDAAVEAGLDPLSSALKQIPRAIADLWEPRSTDAPSNLFTTYVGYTATPQANMLQEDHNPLAPRDFVISLRTPLDVGEPIDPSRVDADRSSTYPEPTGLDNFYIGGEVFYKRGASANLCVELSGVYEDDLGDAIRAFLVAGAIRLHRTEGVMGPHSLSSSVFDSRESALRASPEPHSMLFHPSSEIERHFAGAEDILMWAGVEDRDAARASIKSGDGRLPLSLIARMREEEDLWEEWLERYRISALEVADQFNLLRPRPIPDWATVRSTLEAEIIPGTRVSVVNSDPDADDRPEYRPSSDKLTGLWRPARDLSTIFVSGNVMSRGLTLEGMTTALFERASTSPLADTQMQMQRWFGYRGKHVELCRLFATTHQLSLFSAYHDIDEAVRVAITGSMSGAAPSPVVLHGLDFLATGKIASLGRTPLCPGAKPFVTINNGGHEPDPNIELVADLFRGQSSEVRVGGRVRGRILDETLSLNEAADLLSRFSYDTYRPGMNHRVAELWSSVQARVSAAIPLPAGTELYSAPEPGDKEASTPINDCPYAISAYLRLWNACLSRPVRGLFVTGSPSELWSMSSLHDKEASQPRFAIGIRYGAGQVITDGPLGDLNFAVPATTKGVLNSGNLANEWGSNDPSAGDNAYRGDEFFDYYNRGERLPPANRETAWRPAGSFGQILFYLNQPAGQPYPVVSFGVCIPAGGPEQFAATRVAGDAASTGGTA